MADETDLTDRFLDALWLHDRLSQSTIGSYRRDLAKLSARLDARGKTWMDAQADDLSEAVYDADEEPSSKARALSACKRFYAWLEEMEIRSENPTAALKSPKRNQTLPPLVMAEQIDKLLSLPDTDSVHGLRDKALLEIIYATGMRVSEAVQLDISDVDIHSGCVQPFGKGGKRRLVPMGQEASYWVEQYCLFSRPVLLKNTASDALFVSQKKTRISRQLAWMAVKEYANLAGLENISPHTLRHAFATHLVNNGMDLRSVQMLLGHADLNTTQIYTHVADIRLKNLVAEHHSRN